ncbi:MAG TPA: glycosyltransferase [Verrucomicrobiae bacterium]|nr:glycosyltransferase [Verrucomicrobiae bacterium]
MWPRLEWLLVGWTALAAGWWIYALRLVRCRMTAENEGAASPTPTTGSAQTLTVFKPLCALRTPVPSSKLVAALESFVAQTGDGAEVLFGVEQQDAAAWEPIFAAWRRRYSKARFTVVCQPRPATFRSPKSSWWHALAGRAQGRLWLWSDADMIAVPGLLTTLRGEQSATNSGLVTCPYVIRRVTLRPMWLEALFVNAEFYPGVLACRAWGKPSFAFGAAMLFDADDLQQRLPWDELGARMAEDNLLGRRLAPVHISSVTLETLSAETRWTDAVLHYLRWHKTVRWCRPAGYAAELIITPVLGWLGAVLWQPTAWWTWTGLGVTVLLEALVAARLCARVGCAPRLRDAPVLAGWSGLRALTWLACWLPWPVVFRSQRRIWWNLYRCSEAGT